MRYILAEMELVGIITESEDDIDTSWMWNDDEEIWELSGPLIVKNAVSFFLKNSH